MAKKFTKKAGVVQVVEWTGKNLGEMQKFIPAPHAFVGTEWYIDTLDGRVLCKPGQFVAKYKDDVNGVHFRVYNKEYFLNNYEEVK